MSDPTITEQRSYYDGLWKTVASTELNGHEQARLQAIRATLTRHVGATGTIADVGCGRGWLSGLVLAEFGTVEGFDLSPASVEKARETFPSLMFQARDVMADGINGPYDLVVSSEVIEHIADQQRFADLLVDAVKPGGHVLVTTPNARLEKRWRSASSFHPQPIEKWLAPKDLHRLLEGRCEIVDWTTLYFDVGDAGAYRVINNRVSKAVRVRVPAIDARLGRLQMGLYQLALFRRR